MSQNINYAGIDYLSIIPLRKGLMFIRFKPIFRNMAKNAAMKRIFFAVIVFAVVLSSFYILDFKVARSETLTNSTISAYSTGDPQIDSPGRFYLYVEGDDSISKSLNITGYIHLFTPLRISLSSF